MDARCVTFFGWSLAAMGLNTLAAGVFFMN